jgi:hypothetical protein
MNKSKIKGTYMETRAVNHLIARGFKYAERRALQGTNDRGDVSGIPGVVIEVKNQKQMDLAGWIDETLAEQKNAGASVAFCVFPRRNRSIGQAYVVMTFDQAISLISD